MGEHEAERRRLVDEREHEAMEYKRFAEDHAKQHKVLEQQAREREEAAEAQLQQFETDRQTWINIEEEKNARIAELERQLRDATIHGVQTSFKHKNMGGNNNSGGTANALSPRPAKGELGRRLQRGGEELIEAAQLASRLIAGLRNVKTDLLSPRDTSPRGVANGGLAAADNAGSNGSTEPRYHNGLSQM